MSGPVTIPRARRNKTTSRGGSKANSRQNSVNNSANNSPIVSPNRYNPLRALSVEDNDNEDEVWHCEICSKAFSNTNDKLLECQRCCNCYCIACLGKTEAEYNLLNDSDLMWFCIQCREKVQKNIITDRKIEDTCKEMMKALEDRLTNIETKVDEKCSKSEAKAMIQEELDKRLTGPHSDTGSAAAASATSYGAATATTGEITNQVVSELNERKLRENNVVFYGIDEISGKPFEERQTHDLQKVLEVVDEMEVELETDNIVKTARLGKFDHRKKKRPLLVQLKNSNKKVEIFRNATKLKNSEIDSFKEVQVSNDLTPAERENEKRLYEQAKEMQKNCTDYKFRVRGPPWARKIVKVKVAEETQDLENQEEK